MTATVGTIFLVFGGLMLGSALAISGSLAPPDTAWWTWKLGLTGFGLAFGGVPTAIGVAMLPADQRREFLGTALQITAVGALCVALTFYSLFGSEEVRRIDPKFAVGTADYLYFGCCVALLFGAGAACRRRSVA
ncbi:MAG: hypothetical protein JNL96_24000 [Planctomycetaceae bacterium]|nr:hypothetical protein [Planctomycetaceae bacterium]